MQTWAERFKEIRGKKGLSQYEIGRSIEKDVTQISRYESGGTKTFTRALQRALKDIFSDAEIEYIKNGDKIPSEVEEPSLAYGIHTENVTIPYHREVYASAGGGSDATCIVETSPVTFSKTFLNSYLGIHNLKGLSIINAAGDSMKPTIRSGAMMFVYPIENEGFKDGGVYVLMCGDALLVKRVWLNPTTSTYTLRSDNETVSDMTLTIDEGSECHFVGRVVGHLDRV